jgi:hypothetical protein
MKKKDQNILSSDGLVNFIKSNLKKPTEENVLKGLKALATPAADLTHLTKEGELPWGWYTHTREFTSKIEKEYSYFLNLWLDNRSKSPREEYSALKSFVLYLEDVEKLCKSKGECYEFWFYEILTSRDYLDQRKAELKELTYNFDELCAEYEKRITLLVDIDAKIIKELKANPNILQADFVKIFDPFIQNDVREKLYYLAKSGKLERTKSGRSYTLRYKG